VLPFIALLSAIPPPFVVKQSEAPAYVLPGGKGSVRLYYGAGTTSAALSVLTLAPGAEVAKHVHADSNEMLYIESGEIETIIAGETVRAKAGDAVLILAGFEHSARVVSRFEGVRAVQIYTPSGPEQRFKSGERLP
jgi:putative monooxygenase